MIIAIFPQSFVTINRIKYVFFLLCSDQVTMSFRDSQVEVSDMKIFKGIGIFLYVCDKFLRYMIFYCIFATKFKSFVDGE